MGVAGLFRRGRNRAEAHRASPDTTAPRCLLCFKESLKVPQKKSSAWNWHFYQMWWNRCLTTVHSWIQESVDGFVYSEIRQHVLRNTEIIKNLYRNRPRLVSLTLTTAVCVELPGWLTEGRLALMSEMLRSLSLPGRDLTSGSIMQTHY